MQNLLTVAQHGAGALVWQGAQMMANRLENPNLKALMRISLVAGLMLATYKAAKQEDSSASRFSRGFVGMAGLKFAVSYLMTLRNPSIESTVGTTFLF